MKIKRVSILTIALLLCFNVIAMAKEKVPEQHDRGNMFMGEVLDVQKDGKNTKLLVEGYLKNCDVYKEQLLVIVSENTKIVNQCNEDKKDEKDNKKNPVEFIKGDKVFMVLDKAMTKSVPPQVNALRIKVTKVNK